METLSTAVANLELKGITKAFPGVIALNDVSLTVNKGEVHGVVGENGAGKSTLMAIAAGSLAVDKGEVWVNGTSLSGAGPTAARALGIAIVRQEPALLPDLTVAENLQNGVSAARRPHARDAIRWSEKVLGAWGDDVKVRPQDRVEQLNPHERFVVEICRALAQDPEVLILDEPTEHLIGGELEVLFGHIRSYTARGRSVIYISHRVNEVKLIADRITVLRNGRSEGTHLTAELSEDEIVKLIIGRDLDSYFPAKPDAAASSSAGLVVQELSARGLSGISVDFHPGEIVGLAGIEGNGQRTFMRALAGLEHASGTYSLDGAASRKPTQSSAVASRILYMSGDRHNEGVLAGLNVGENIVFRSLARLARGGWLTERPVTALAQGVVNRYNVKTPSLETNIESLSGGNQQKALIGAVMAAEPRVILIDEPTQGVDVGAKHEIYEAIRAMAAEGTVVLVLSSNGLELAGLADRVLVFSRGQVISDLRGADVTEEAITGAALKTVSERARVSTSVRPLTRWLAGDAAPAVIVAALIVALTVVGAAANPLFLSPVNISGLLFLAVPIAIVAFGQLTVLMTGGIDLSTGPLMGLVVIVASYYLIDNSPVESQLTGWILIAAVALGVGLVNWVLIDVVHITPLLATLVTFMAIQAVSQIARPVPGGSISSQLTDALVVRWGPFPVIFVATVVGAIALNLVLKRSRVGILLRAVGSNSEAARMTGARPRVVRLMAYLACSALAAVAGIALIAQLGVGDASAGVDYTLLGITAAVVGGASVFGGRGSYLGALLGAILIQLMDVLTTFLRLPTQWHYFLVGGLTIGAVAAYSTARRRASARN